MANSEGSAHGHGTDAHRALGSSAPSRGIRCYGDRVRLHPECMGPIGAVDVSHLTPLVVRFRLDGSRAISPYVALLLAGGEDTSTILPEAPNRAGIQHNFEAARRRVRASYEEHAGSELFREASVGSPAAWLAFHAAHQADPGAWLYFDGQRLASLVERAPQRVEVMLHEGLDAFLAFTSAYGYPALPGPDAITCFACVEAAETWIGGALARVEVRALPVRREEGEGFILLQACGVGPDHDRRFFVHLDGRSREVRIGRDHEPYALLNDLSEALSDGYVRTCATCRSFRFSGMSRDMSGGSMGYCERRREAARASGIAFSGVDTVPPHLTTISVYDTCAAHELVLDADRAIPYLARSRAR